MSFLSKLFKNKNSEKHDMEQKSTMKHLSIHDMKFTKAPDGEVEKVWQQIISGELSEAEQEKFKREMLAKCKMTTLAQNGVKLYRMAKSNDEIASQSLEGWKCIVHNPHSVVEGNSNGHGFSLTTPESLILCIPYGDIVTEIEFDDKRLKENNMESLYVYEVGYSFDEYLATKFLTGDIWSISKPETLKMVIDMSSDASFEKSLTIDNKDNYSIHKALSKFHFLDTLTYWDRIKDRYQELVKMNVENKIGILRTELGEILKNTLTVGNEMFAGNEQFNITTSLDENEKSI